MNINKITFVFQSGRIKRLNNSNEEFSKEFFYSYLDFKKEFTNVNIIEFSEKQNILNVMFKPIFKLARYVTTIPFYCERIISFENIKTLRQSENIIFTNQRVAFSTMPVMLIMSIFKKRNITVFIMGLFVNQSRNILRKYFREKFIILLLKTSTNIIFLSNGEKNFAEKNYLKYKEKMFFLPFPVDSKFWNKNNSKNNNKVLFIGNDGKRDYELVTNIARKMINYEFIFVSKQFKNINLPKNVKLYHGKWADNEISDLKIRDIYAECFVSIIPLKDSIQPSGQSVALQSMSMKIPVIITKTKGFWEEEKFRDNKNIFFVMKNNIDDWEEKISLVYSDKNLVRDVCESAYRTLIDNYTLEKFYSEFKKIIT